MDPAAEPQLPGRLVFVLPDDRQRISGGNLYNARLLEAARERRPVAAIDAARWREEIAAGEIGTYVVDTVLLRDFAVALSSKPAGQRWLLLVHHLPSLEPGLAEDAPARHDEARVLAACDGFVVASRFTAALLRARGLGAVPIVTVPPALAVGAAAERRAWPSAPRALMVANLIARKAVAPWLEHLARRVLPTDRWGLDLLGRDDLEPDHAAACHQIVAATPLLRDRVCFVGAVSPEAMSTYYQRAALLVSASAMETFGMALQEARAHGLPILVRAGGHAAAHVEPGVTGLVCDRLDELADAFVQQLREPTALRSWFDVAQARAAAAVARCGGWTEAAQSLLAQLAAADYSSHRPAIE
ncbi:MAG: glycosyltransferase family 4 protein [Planctomycetota bacterium]